MYSNVSMNKKFGNVNFKLLIIIFAICNEDIERGKEIIISMMEFYAFQNYF